MKLLLLLIVGIVILLKLPIQLLEKAASKYDALK